MRLVKEKERWEATNHLQGVLPYNWGGTEASRTVTFGVLKATANDMRTTKHHFNCEVCGKAFAKRTHLMQHEKMHTERNFICLKCGKDFSQKGCLKRHMLCHVMEERTRIKVEL
ncbi:UNVERIFIED_CONTAM: zinc finger protein [Trichonephila clavipes]